ncbi:hypothetical protein QEW_3768 [Clostridioides difficile CD160]|nr:hypothetical protein QEW_3768 [Clostridioides difficile CD160]
MGLLIHLNILTIHRMGVRIFYRNENTQNGYERKEEINETQIKKN